ncbi:MAG TPA: FGGY family carbohydrate kinase [Actinopolymorphaceae bacterium]|jgi:xylulokinase
MRSGLTIGLDVGTGSAKAVVLDPGRDVLGRGSSETYPTTTPAPGRAEQDPLDWWRAAGEAVRKALAAAGLPGGSRDVTAIAVSGQGAALVLVDGGLAPVGPALIHLDQRSSAEASELAEGPAGQAILRANGQRPGAWNVAAKLCWVRRNQPERVRAARGLTSAAGFVLAQLTGRLVQSASDAGISDLFDLTSRDWASDVLAALDIDPAFLPEVAPATAEVGGLTAEAQRELGLSGRVRVVAGGEDTSSAALAAGVVGRDGTYLSLGSAGVVGVAVERGSVREPRLLTFPHVRDDVDLLSGSMTSAGSALSWWAEITGREPADLLAEAEHTQPGAGGVVFLPYLAGELHPIADPDARGVFTGLSFASGRAELTRAIIEGSATAIAHNLDVAVAAGARPGGLSATGGPTRSAVWMRAVAAATNRVVEVVDTQGAPLGDAMLAAGESDDEVAELVAAHRRVQARYEPDEREAEAARERRQQATELYHAVRALRTRRTE